MNSKELMAKAATALAEAKALQAQAGEKMTPEISAKIAEALGKSDEFKAQGELAKRVEDGEKFFGEPAAPKAAPVGWRPAGPDEGDAPVDPKAFRQIEVDTPVGKKTIRFHVPLTVQGKGYSPAFEAYLRKGIDSMGPQDRKTLTEGTDSAGGFTVPEDYQTEVIKKMAAATVIRALARVQQTGRDILSWPRITYATNNIYTSGVRLTWTGEAPATASVHRVTDPVFGVIKIPVHTAMASMPMSNDLLEDSAFDMFGMSSDLFGEAFALGEDDVFINGTGIAQPLGLLNSPGSTDRIGTAASGTTSSLTADGLISLFYAVPAQYRLNAAFVMNSATMAVVEKLKDLSLRYLVQSMVNGSLASAQFEVIKGKRVLCDEFMPDVAASAYPIVFGDFKGYIIADRVGLSLQRLTDSAYSELNLTGLLARKRVGGQLAEPYRLKAQGVAAA
jgi:HK97 family phage major capsid protein